MNDSIQFTVDETLEIFRFLENCNELFHQEMNYTNKEIVSKFARSNYPKIRKLYYDTIWNKLPKSIQNEITEE